MTAPSCFGCGGSFERALLEEVGDALFCRLCLGRLLRRVEERGSGGAAERGSGGAGDRPADPPPAVSAPAADAPCFLCGGPLEEEPFVRLRGFAICAVCSRALGGDLPDEGAADGEAQPAREARAPASGGDPDGDSDADSDGEPTATPGAGTEWCAGCGRPMPGPGSYQLVAGRPHCSACVAARRPRRAERGAGAAGLQPCDACRRATEPDALRPTHGFRLCLACLESDPALALALAQARHRRRLERQGRRLLGEEDDD
jgi:hypothetical protein